MGSFPLRQGCRTMISGLSGRTLLRRTLFLHRFTRTFLLAALVASPACDRAKRDRRPDPLIVYCSVDEAFARQVLDVYRDRSGTELAVVFDSEAGKTTGLVNKIISEARSGRPRADVFWSSELFNTISLARGGLLTPYDPPSAADIPQRFKGPEHHWTGVAVRARVLAFDPTRVSKSDVPTTWARLADPRVATRTALANPLFGTTRGHVSAMFALWGSQRGRGFLLRLREAGIQIVDGNSSAVRAVMAGRAAFAVTDTDDVWLAQKSGASLDLVYPDMGGGGTLLIPCSVALVKGGAGGTAAKALVDYLVSAEVERMLAKSDSRNIPVRPALRSELGLEWPAETRIDYGKVAGAMSEAMDIVRDVLIR